VFVRCKVRDGLAYHYLVMTERVCGRVWQKTIAYLGDYATVDAALEGLPTEIAKLKEEARECAVRADRVRLYLGAGTLERNSEEVPRSTRGRGQSMSQHGRKVCNEYWFKRERAELCDKLIRQKTKQLNKLREACSAHNASVNYRIVGTTSKAPGGELRVRWGVREYVRAGQGPVRVCFLDRLQGSERRQTVCCLAKRAEKFFGTSDMGSDIRFWKRVTAKLDGLRLSTHERANVEAQLASTVRRPSHDEVNKYDEGAAKFWGGLRQAREEREAREHARWEDGQAQRARWKAERSAHEVPGDGKI
jgi:hypothetical protein